jgi:hypothetical protein
LSWASTGFLDTRQTFGLLSRALPPQPERAQIDENCQDDCPEQDTIRKDLMNDVRHALLIFHAAYRVKMLRLLPLTEN